MFLEFFIVNKIYLQKIARNFLDYFAQFIDIVAYLCLEALCCYDKEHRHFILADHSPSFSLKRVSSYNKIFVFTNFSLDDKIAFNLESISSPDKIET